MTHTSTQQPEAQRFTKKPVTIVASQWFKSGDHPAVRDISDSDDLFFTGMGGATLVEREKFGVIGTLESPNHLVTPGDWIITGVQGEHYPCKPDIFEATYAPETKLQQGVQTTMSQLKANCYSDDHGDYWRDCPDDCDFVEGLKVGDTFELQASIRAWSETFRVTKAPDETSDDYEVELVSSDAPAHPAEGVPAQVVELEVDDLIDRLLNAQQDLNLAANVHMDQSIASASTLLDEVEIALRTLAATHPTQQGLELANCKGDKWLTVVYRDIQPGDESRTIGEHPKVSALSWSHALHDRDAALAAQAKKGEPKP